MIALRSERFARPQLAVTFFACALACALAPARAHELDPPAYAVPTYDILDARWAGGADPTGRRDVGPVLQAVLDAIASSPSGNGTIVVPAGTYAWASGVVTPAGCKGFTLAGAAQSTAIFRLTSGNFAPAPGSPSYNLGEGARALLSLGDYRSGSSSAVAVSIHDLTFDESKQNLGRPNWYIALFTDVAMRTVAHSSFERLTFKLGGTNVGAWLFGVGDTTPMTDLTVRDVTAYDGDGVFLISPVVSPTFPVSAKGTFAAGRITIDGVTSYVTMNGISDDRIAIGFGGLASTPNAYALLDGVTIAHQAVYVSPSVTSTVVNPVKLETDGGGRGSGVVLRDVLIDGLTVRGSAALTSGEVYTLASYVDDDRSFLENTTVRNVDAKDAGRIFWRNGPHFPNSTYTFANLNLRDVDDSTALDFWAQYRPVSGEHLVVSNVSLTSAFTGTRFTPFPLGVKLGNVAGGPGYGKTSIVTLAATDFKTGITSDYDETGGTVDNAFGVVDVTGLTFRDSDDPAGFAWPVIPSPDTRFVMNGIDARLRPADGVALRDARGARRAVTDPQGLPLLPRALLDAWRRALISSTSRGHLGAVRSAGCAPSRSMPPGSSKPDLSTCAARSGTR